MTPIKDLYRISKLYSLPEFVKKASDSQIYPKDTDVADPRSVYAWPKKEMYPVHTPAATWISAASFYDSPPNTSNSELDLIGRRIKEAALYFGIEKHVEEVEKHAKANRDYSLQNEPDDVFALVWTSETGEKQRMIPLRNSQEVKTAAEWFVNYRDDFLYKDRKKIASKILAADKGVLDEDTREVMRKHAGYGFCAPSRAANLVRRRALCVPGKEKTAREGLNKIAAAITKDPKMILNSKTRFKLAEVIDEIDNKLALKSRYDEGLPRAEDILFELSLEKMSEVNEEHVRLTSGAVYKKADLEKISLSTLRKHFGDDFAEDVSDDGLYVNREKLAVIMRTLPRNDAEMIERLLEDSNIEPVAKEAADRRQGLMHSN